MIGGVKSGVKVALCLAVGTLAGNAVANLMERGSGKQLSADARFHLSAAGSVAAGMAGRAVGIAGVGGAGVIGAVAVEGLWAANRLNLSSSAAQLFTAKSPTVNSQWGDTLTYNPATGGVSGAVAAPALPAPTYAASAAPAPTQVTYIQQAAKPQSDLASILGSAFQAGGSVLSAYLGGSKGDSLDHLVGR